MLLETEFEALDHHLDLARQVEHCLQCSICAISCIVQYSADYTPRHTFVYDLFREDGYDNPNLWGCPACYKCVTRCPYDFRALDLVRAHKAEALRRGVAPPQVLGEVEAILETGLAFPISNVTERLRGQLGLPALPTPPVDEVRAMARALGLQGGAE